MSFTEIPGCLHDDPRLSDDDKLSIDVLTEAEAASSWDTYVSKLDRHFKLLGKSEWPVRLVANAPVFYSWSKDWNEGRPFSFMQAMEALEHHSTDTVYVFWMRETCARTRWSVFVKNWINFLYEDEGCIVLSENRQTALVFSNGHSWVGTRPHL